MILILKTGSMLDKIKASHGDFEDRIIDAAISRLTIQEQLDELSSEGFDVQKLLNNVAEAGYGAKIFKRFKELIHVFRET